jgi:hypothetical protein
MIKRRIIKTNFIEFGYQYFYLLALKVYKSLKFGVRHLCAPNTNAVVYDKKENYENYFF